MNFDHIHPGANAQYSPLSLALPSHIELLRQRQAAFLDENGAGLFPASTCCVSNPSPPAHELSIPQDIRTLRSAEQETPPIPHSRTIYKVSTSPTVNEPPSSHSDVERGRVQRISVASLSSVGRILPHIYPPVSPSLSEDLDSALSSSLGGSRPLIEGLQLSNVNLSSSNSPNVVQQVPKTSETHPIK